MKKRKILYVSGTRADYGLMRETLFAVSKSPKLSLEILACGMHVMPEFGNTIDEIKRDGFLVHRVPAVFKKDSKESMAVFTGACIELFTEKVAKIKPDIIFVQGDRAESLAGAIVGVYLGIPVVHTHGGDVSMTVDDVVRNAVTKLASVHFSATKKSADRIVKMGEEKRNVYVVGAPGLDDIAAAKFTGLREAAKKYGINLLKPLLLVVQHPVSEQVAEAALQMEATMSAVKELGLQTIVVYPNADAGGRKMIAVIEKYRKYPFIKIHKNIPHNDFLGLMGMAVAMVGNSSGGIIEAPSFYLPTVNIGIRQQGRERAVNVIDVGHSKEQIKRAVAKALDEKFMAKVRGAKSPYGDGTASVKITKVLEELDSKFHGKI